MTSQFAFPRVLASMFKRHEILRMAIREGKRLVDMRFFYSRLMEVVRVRSAQACTSKPEEVPGRTCLSIGG